MKALAGLLALVAGTPGPAANADPVMPTRSAATRMSLPPKDPNAKKRARLLKARAFVAQDGLTYPVGPCGYVPKSAQFDPARRKVRS